MVSFYALSIFLLYIVTVLGSQFWGDIDTLYNELSSPRDLPTQSTANEVQQVESTPPVPHPSPSPIVMAELQSRRKEHLKRKFYQKNVTLSPEEVEAFKQATTVDHSYSQNISLALIKSKLLAFDCLEEWFDIDTYDIEKYPKYWAKVCVAFWGKPLDSNHRYACSIYPSYGVYKKKSITIKGKKRYLDLLYCKCHIYENKAKVGLTRSETFLIHKSSRNEFYIFQTNATNLKIKGFKGGITLPIPHEELQITASGSRYAEKFVTLEPHDIEILNDSLTIDKSYPENISLAELEGKLMEFEEVHNWPDLKKYNLNAYSMYWANLCVLLWSKQLDRTHRQACVVSTIYGTNRIQKLFIQGRTLQFDLLYCKCHSYITKCKSPVSSVDTFLIHRTGQNEFFVFEQRPTVESQYTLFIKGFKRMINLPDPEAFT